MVKVHLDNTQIIVQAAPGMELADIAGTTATPDKVLSGYKFVGTDGALNEGTYTQESYADFDGYTFYGSGNVIVDTYATKASVPTKVSQLTNDSGYLTSHQDLSAYAKKTDIPSVPVKGVKVDGSTSKLTPDSSGVVTIPAIPTAVSSFTNDAGYLTAHQDISGKADKSTTLAGYGITDAYTSTEVDSKIKAAIGAIADYDSTAF